MPATAAAALVSIRPQRKDKQDFEGRFVRRLLRNIALALFIVLVAGPIATVLLYRFIPPPVTPLMVIRAIEGRGLDHRWRGIRKVAPALPRALIAAEDARFCEHHGFDFDALQKAYENNEAGKALVAAGPQL